MCGFDLKHIKNFLKILEIQLKIRTAFLQKINMIKFELLRLIKIKIKHSIVK